GTLELSDISLRVNQASGARDLDGNPATLQDVQSANPLNWETAIPTAGLTLVSTVRLEVKATVVLDLFEFLSGTATLTYRQQIVDVDVDGDGVFEPATTDLEDASLMTFELEVEDVFIGIDDTGFAADGGTLAIAQIKPKKPTVLPAADTRTFMVVRGSLTQASLEGIDGLTAIADVAVEMNQAKGAKSGVNAVALDWTESVDLGADAEEEEGFAPDAVELAGAPVSSTGDILKVDGALTLQVEAGGVAVGIAGRFGFEKSTLNAGTPAAVSVMKVYVSDASASLAIGEGASGFRIALLDINGAFLIKGAVAPQKGGAAGLLTLGAIEITSADGSEPFAGLSFALRDFALSFNTTGAPVHETIGDLDLDFATGAATLAVSGSLDLNIADVVTLSGTFGFKKVTGATPAASTIEIVAQDVNAALEVGSFKVGIEDGSLALLMTGDGKLALEASGGLIFQGGDFANVTARKVSVVYSTMATDFRTNHRTLDVNGITATLSTGPGSPTPLLGLSVEGLDAQFAGLVRLKGDFSFQKSSVPGYGSVLKIAVANLETGFGDGTTEYVRLSEGTGAFLMTSTGMAGEASVRVALNGVDGVSLSDPAGGGDTRLTFALNTMPTAVKQTFTMGDTVVPLDLPKGRFIRASADPLFLTINGTTLQGRIGFLQSTKADGSKIVVIQALGISVQNFSGEGSGGSPVTITDANGTLVLMNGKVAGSLGFTVEGAFGAFSGGGTLKLETNQIGTAVNVNGPFGSVVMDPGFYTRISISNLSLVLPGVEIEGDFSFRQGLQGSTPVQAIVGNNVRAFVGDNSGATPVGLELLEGTAVLVRNGTTGTEAGYITGRVRIVGVDGLILDSVLTLRINEFATSINQTFVLDGETIALRFGSTEVASGADSFIQFTGENTLLSIADTVALRGNFGFTKSAGRILIGAQDAQAFVGQGPAWFADGSVNPEAVGLLVSDINLGLVLNADRTFA
ncbi:MAG: hypothetical protein IT580_08185, partial [Verrucomicrobiales bacterium]|nr:hypothetical protein [Verrucomicrobiales bacterium]